MAKAKKQEPAVQLLIPNDECPFELPDNWIWTRLGNLGHTNIGLTYSPKDTSDSGIIVLRSSNIQNGLMDYKDIVRVKTQVPENKMCQKGDILICARNGSKALVGKTAVVDADGMSYGAFMAIFRSEYNSLIFHYLNSPYFRNIIDRDVGTTTINQVTQTLIKGLPFPLPPLPEQHRIVARIKSLFDKLDRAKTLVQSALDSFETRRAAILHKAFTGELTAKWREDNGVGLESWEEKSARDVCGFITKGETPTKFVSDTGDIPFLKVYNIRGNKLDFDYNPAFIPSKIHKEKMKRSVVYPGDVIMNIVGPPLQKVAIVTDQYPEYNINQAIAIFRPRESVLGRYLYHLLLWENTLTEVLGDVRGVVGQSNISLEQCRDLQIPVPSLLEQQEIVRILDDLLAKEKAAQELTNTIEKIDHMKKAILARAFRGELGTNDPSEESAVELLKENIKA